MGVEGNEVNDDVDYDDELRAEADDLAVAAGIARGAPQPDEVTIDALGLALRLGAERDAARAELAALQQRIKDLCVDDKGVEWGVLFVSVAALRAALAGAAPAGETP